MTRTSLLVMVVATTFSAGAVAQSGELTCSPAMALGNVQTAAIARSAAGPYSLTATIKEEMTFADGNTISGFTTSRQAVDREGRTRMENPGLCVMDKNHQPKWQGQIAIKDPVTNTQIWLYENAYTGAKTAVVSHAVVFSDAPKPPSAQEDFQRELRRAESFAKTNPKLKPYLQQVKVEDLGKRNIAGLEAMGIRITHTWPVGLIGNSMPMSTVEERWLSVQYGIYLLDINDDPFMGKSTYKVTSFSNSEPERSLFEAPSDYKVTEQGKAQ